MLVRVSHSHLVLDLLIYLRERGFAAIENGRDGVSVFQAEPNHLARALLAWTAIHPGVKAEVNGQQPGVVNTPASASDPAA